MNNNDIINRHLFMPISRIADDGGPIKMMPSCLHSSANSVFSDRKPYPGWTAFNTNIKSYKCQHSKIFTVIKLLVMTIWFSLFYLIFITHHFSISSIDNEVNPFPSSHTPKIQVCTFWTHAQTSKINTNCTIWKTHNWSRTSCKKNKHGVQACETCVQAWTCETWVLLMSHYEEI